MSSHARTSLFSYLKSTEQLPHSDDEAFFSPEFLFESAGENSTLVQYLNSLFPHSSPRLNFNGDHLDIYLPPSVFEKNQQHLSAIGEKTSTHFHYFVDPVKGTLTILENFDHTERFPQLGDGATFRDSHSPITLHLGAVSMLTSLHVVSGVEFPEAHSFDLTRQNLFYHPDYDPDGFGFIGSEVVSVDGRTDLETALHQIVAEYVIGRFGIVQKNKRTTSHEFTFSPKGFLDAWRRVHPKMSDDRVRFTPMVPSVFLSMMSGALEVIAKDDSHQRTGSFKGRGAHNLVGWVMENFSEKVNHDKRKNVQRIIKDTFEAAGDDNLLRLSAQAMLKIPQNFNKDTLTLIAASHGNHANGVMEAARTFDIKNVVLVIPAQLTTQKIKIRQCLKQGAIVILAGKALHESMEIARSIEKETIQKYLKRQETLILPATATDEEINAAYESKKIIVMYGDPESKARTEKTILRRISQVPRAGLFVPTYDHPLIAMGQATDIFEMLGMRPSMMNEDWMIINALGGGGKKAGTSKLIQMIAPHIETKGAISEKNPAFALSMDAGTYTLDANLLVQPEDEVQTAADGAYVPRIGEIPFHAIHQTNSSKDILRITEHEIEEALVFLDAYPWYNGERKRVEGAPAMAVAALLNGAAGAVENKRIVISISGKNIDDTTFNTIKEKKSWVADDLELYRNVLALRTHVRSCFPEDQSQQLRWIQELNKELYVDNKFIFGSDRKAHSNQLIGKMNQLSQGKIGRNFAFSSKSPLGSLGKFGTGRKAA